MRFQALLPLFMLLNLCFANSSAQDNLSGSLTVYAATSLTDVFEAMRDAFAETYPDVTILLNFANSATLAAQLTAGAPADVFASANELQMQVAVESARVDEADVEIFAHNRLVLIVPAGNPATVHSLDDLTRDNILLVLAAEGTPIRAYTNAMLASYSDERGDSFTKGVLRNLVSEESNVRQVVARIALGEADAGIVYQSDALGDVADQLIAIPVAERHNQLASYPIAPLLDAAEPSLAERFMRFVLSDEALAILEANGFCWPARQDDVEVDEGATEPALEIPDLGEATKIECEAASLEDG